MIDTLGVFVGQSLFQKTLKYALALALLLAITACSERLPWPTGDDDSDQPETPPRSQISVPEVLMGQWKSSCMNTGTTGSNEFVVHMDSNGEFQVKVYKYLGADCEGLRIQYSPKNGKVQEISSLAGDSWTVRAHMKGPYGVGDVVSSEVLVSIESGLLVVHPIHAEVYGLDKNELLKWKDDDPSTEWTLRPLP